MKLKPDFSFEKALWKRGILCVAGIDEVGRGCFAGPVVAAAVAFAPNSKFQVPISNGKDKRIIINDSKKMTAKQRENADKWIRENAFCWGIGEASVVEINRLGIGKATKAAFRQAIKRVSAKLQMTNAKLDFILIDAFHIPHVNGLRRKNQLAIVHGDEKSMSIASASIIAKVYRDRLMTRLSLMPKLKAYKFGKNKGYGTREHRNAILKHGITGYHRKMFVETFLSNNFSSSPAR